MRSARHHHHPQSHFIEELAFVWLPIGLALCALADLVR